MINVAKSGGLELISNSKFNEDIKENPLHIGIKDGFITIFDKDGNDITGIIGVDVKTHVDDLMIVNIKMLINKEFFICDPITVRGEE